MEHASKTVVVVGAGLAGLSTAYRLASLKQKVILCDAWQVGGRTKSIVLGENDHISVGGTWANFDCDDLLGLAGEVDCLPFAPDLTADGDAVPQMLTHPFTLMYMYNKGKRYTEELLSGKPSESATRLDNMSVQQWLDSLSSFFFPQASKDSVMIWLTQLENLPWDLNTFSALYACIIVYQRLSSPSKTGRLIPQTMRWEGGTGTLVAALRKATVAKGVTIFENCPVKLVEHGADFVKVTGGKEGETTINADYAVFAMSPPAVKENIKFNPPLPTEYEELGESMGKWSDPAYNIVLQFPTRFWAKEENDYRYKNYVPSPLGVQDPHKGRHFNKCFGAVMDLSPTGGTRGYLRILVDPVRAVGQSPSLMKAAAIEYLSKCYGLAKFTEHADECVMTIENWESKAPYLAVTYLWPPNGSYLKHFGTLTKPHQRLFWAGAERSLSGVSWMEGAVTSGTRVAQQIANDMGLDAKKFFDDVEASKKAAVDKVREKPHPEVTTIWSVVSGILRTNLDPFHTSLAQEMGFPVEASPPTEPRQHPNVKIVPKSVDITQISGRDLSAQDLNGSSDPYLRVGWVKRGAKARAINRNSEDFLWQSAVVEHSLEFVFPHKTLGDLQNLEIKTDRLLQIEVWDKDTFTPDDWMGCIWIDLAHIGMPEEVSWHLEEGFGHVSALSGSIDVAFNWHH